LFYAMVIKTNTGMTIKLIHAAAAADTAIAAR
jgi:hypothetical protein